MEAPMDEFSLRGRVALVTGSGRGIGGEIARTVAKAGAAVALTARTAGDVEAVAKEIQAGGGTALAYPTDIADHDDPPRLVERTVDELGGLDLGVDKPAGGYE